MSPRAFQRRDFDELERRRMRGARLLHRGISQAEVARQVKVSRESVRRWANRMAQEGAAAALRKAGRAGRKPRLSEKQLQQLEARLREGAEKAGFSNGLWTLERVAGVIREQFGGCPLRLRSRRAEKEGDRGARLRLRIRPRDVRSERYRPCSCKRCAFRSKSTQTL